MSRTVAMLALTTLGACRLHAPPREACANVILGACGEPERTPEPCGRGRARNVDDGSCLTTRDTRELARIAGLGVEDEDLVRCEAEGDELAASPRLGKLGCLPAAPSLAPCPIRTVREGSACAPLEGATATGRAMIDLPRWTRAAATAICARLARSAVALALADGTVALEIAASVPNNDVTQGFLRIRATPAVADDDLERARRPADDALRRLGGIASATDVTVALSCRVRSGRPVSLP